MDLTNNLIPMVVGCIVFAVVVLRMAFKRRSVRRARESEDRPRVQERKPIHVEQANLNAETAAKQIAQGNKPTPGRLIKESTPVPDNFKMDYLFLTLGIITLPIIAISELIRRNTRYTISERCIDIRRGVLTKRRYQLWLWQVTEVRWSQTFAQRLCKVASISVIYEHNDEFGGKQRREIVPSIAPLEEMHALYEFLQQRVLTERREMKAAFL
jgi:hypothetical protein